MSPWRQRTLCSCGRFVNTVDGKLLRHWRRDNTDWCEVGEEHARLGIDTWLTGPEDEVTVTWRGAGVTTIAGNLPGEPQPEVTEAPALELEATRCGDCPFADEQEEGYRCGADQDRRYSVFYEQEAGRPDWCPLERGDVVVRLRR